MPRADNDAQRMIEVEHKKGRKKKGPKRLVAVPSSGGGLRVRIRREMLPTPNFTNTNDSDDGTDSEDDGTNSGDDEIDSDNYDVPNVLQSLELSSSSGDEESEMNPK